MKKYPINPDFDRDELKKLLDEFVSTNGKAKTISEKIRREVLINNQQELLTDTLIQFSKWCHTGHSYVGGQAVARKISILLFGEVIPRLD
ncbi:MAG: hypothetical protein ACXAAM_08615 [Candidatus Heimdallarchaeaceae archaeon]|jgi:hypothetical protein